MRLRRCQRTWATKERRRALLREILPPQIRRNPGERYAELLDRRSRVLTAATYRRGPIVCWAERVHRPGTSDNHPSVNLLVWHAQVAQGLPPAAEPRTGDRQARAGRWVARLCFLHPAIWRAALRSSCRSAVGQAGVTGVPPTTGRGRILTAAFDNYKRLLRKAVSLRSCQQDQACLR